MNKQTYVRHTSSSKVANAAHGLWQTIMRVRIEIGAHLVRGDFKTNNLTRSNHVLCRYSVNGYV